MLRHWYLIDKTQLDSFTSMLPWNFVSNVDNHGRTELHYCGIGSRDINNCKAICTSLIEYDAEVNITDHHGKTPLHYFVANKYFNEELANTLVNAGADINFADNEGKTPLHYFVANKYIDQGLVGSLLHASADVHITDNEGKTALHCCAMDMHINSDMVICALLNAGSDVNGTDHEGKTVLHHFVANKYIDESSAITLINAGADVNIADNEGKTALHYCAANMYVDKYLVGILIDAGADVNITDNEGKTALHFCIVNKLSDKGFITTLLNAGADVNTTGTKGRTALFCCVANETVDKELLDILLGNGANVNITDNEGKTALHFCLVNNFSDKGLITTLLNAGADVNTTGNEGKTALHYCAMDIDFDICPRRLSDASADVNITAFHYINSGANIHAIDNRGRTALHYCVSNETFNKELFDILLRNGANVNTTDSEGKTALQLCIANEHFDDRLVYELLAAGADVNVTNEDGKTALHNCIVNKHSDEELINALLSAGADVDIIDNDGRRALHYCARDFHVDFDTAAWTLIDAGADVNFADHKGRTALHYCACNDSVDKELFLTLLATIGNSSVNFPDNEGKTALHLCLVNKDAHEELITALLNAGADVNITDNEGKSSLFYAVHNSDFVRLLVEDADINARDTYGRTPLFYAITQSISCVPYLLNKGNIDVKDSCSVGILTFFIERCLYTKRELHDSSSILQGLDLLARKGLKRKTVSLTVINLAFCKCLYHTSLRALDCFKEVMHLAKQNISKINFKNFAISKTLKMISGEIYHKYTKMVPEVLVTLIELGADPNSVDSDGNTALHYATLLPYYDFAEITQGTILAILNQLKGFGVSFSLKNHNQETPLTFCLSSAWVKTGQRGSFYGVETLEEVCRFLLECGSSREERTKDGECTVHLVLKRFQQALDIHGNDGNIMKGMIQLLKLIVYAGGSRVDVNVSNVDLNTPLHIWASLELKSLKYISLSCLDDFDGLLRASLIPLLDCGAKLNDENKHKETPLHRCRTWTAVKLLIDAGASTNILDSSGRPPLLVAAKNNVFLPSRLRFYRDFSGDPKEFWRTAITYGLDPWAVDNNGESLLSVLIASRAFVLAEALLRVLFEKECYSNATTLSFLNAVCKDTATHENWKSILAGIILTTRKVHCTWKSNKDTPLHFCCRNILTMFQRSDVVNVITSVHWKILGQLRAYGFDCNIPGASGRSCLEEAEKCPALVNLLVEPVDMDIVPFHIHCNYVSESYKPILQKVARQQECHILNSFWFHQDPIAKGTFGVVFAGINKNDGREVAIKRIEKLRMHRNEDQREIKNLTRLSDCEQVVRYLWFFEDDQNYFSYVVLELMEGNLDGLLSGPSDINDSKICLCADVLMGLKYLHGHNILHRDLKPSNILYKDVPKLCLKIADFGLSRCTDVIYSSVHGSIVGTRCWIAPEVLKSANAHSMASDVFSCGLVFHYIFSKKKHPFSPASCSNKGAMVISNETENNIIHDKREGWDGSLCPEAAHLGVMLIESDASRRPAASDALTHPLFWTDKKKTDLLIAVGNQDPEFTCPRTKRTSPLTAVETDLQAHFSTIVQHGTWHDPGLLHMPAIYTEMTRRRKYDTHSLVELVRFIRNVNAHVTELPPPIRKAVLEDCVFFECFPNLVMEVFKAVTTHGWDKSRGEITKALKQ